MAADRKPEPPRSAAAWLGWEVFCRTQGREDWLPRKADAGWPRQGGSCWLPAAEDHPFKGKRFCWRCITKASGWSRRSFAHTKHPSAICWKAERDEATEHAEQDPGSSVESLPAGIRTVQGSSVRVQKLDAAGRPVSPPQDLGSAFVHFEAEEPADTGNLFWPPPGWARPRSVPVHEPPWVIGPDGRHRYAEPPSPDAVRAVHRMAEGLGLPEEIISPDFRDSWPQSWTDDASAAEPVPAVLTEREAQHGPQPLEAHPAEDEDRQPATDEKP